MIKVLEDAKSDKIDLDIQKSLDKISKLLNTWKKWREKCDKQKRILQDLFKNYNLDTSVLNEYIDVIEYNAIHSWKERKSIPSDFILIVRKYDDIYDAYDKCNECAEALYNNNVKIAEAEAYQAKLQDRKAQYTQKLEKINQLPQIIVDFLEKWKQDAYAYYVNRFETYLSTLNDIESDKIKLKRHCIQEYDCYAKYRELYDINSDDDVRYINLHPREPYESLERENELDYRSVERYIKQMFQGVVLKMRECRKSERDAYLRKYLENECTEMKSNLIDQVTELAGDIIDASDIRVGAKGIEGIIIGDKIVNGENVKVRIHTTLSGGYNIQCLHYRFYVNVVK